MRLTYFTGAGASDPTIPIVSKLGANLNSFKGELKNSFNFSKEHFDDSNHTNTITPKDAKERLINEYEWLLQESSNYTTVDTYAKKLYLTKSADSIEDYNKLKKLLSFYFLVKQNLVENEKKYDDIFAAFLTLNEDQAVLPKELSFITWNYDLQPEISLCKFLNKKMDIDFLKFLQLASLFEKIEDLDLNRFCLVKLNGTAGFIFKDNQINFQNKLLTKRLGIDTFDYEFQEYLVNNNAKNLLSFSWDNSDFLKRSIVTAINIFKQTFQLVVIGYSFPVFNREIDKQIFKAFNPRGTIYIQDLNPDPIRETIIELTKIEPDKVKIVKDCSKFFIPVQYTPTY